MSHENVETLYRVYDALRRRDVDGFVREMHPDVEGTARVMSVDGEVFRGHDGMRRFMDEIITVFPDWDVEVADASIHGDRVLATLRLSAHGARSGVPLDQTAWQVIGFREGKILSWHGFPTRSEALEAVGLDE